MPVSLAGIAFTHQIANLSPYAVIATRSHTQEYTHKHDSITRRATGPVQSGAIEECLEMSLYDYFETIRPYQLI